MRIIGLVFWIVLVGLGAGCGDDGGGTPDSQAQLSCASYCGTITTNCTGANQMYMGMDSCMSTCMQFPVGAAADVGGNTLGCRTYHAGAAASDPNTHCRHAGPGGADVCGANCEGFCKLVLGACTDANQQYGGDMGMCMTACATFATDPPYDYSVQMGNSFACRLYHATQASADPGTHCGHTAVVSDTCKM